MASRCRNGILISLLLSVVVLAGCAKRPAMTAASAPAPTGAAQATTPPAVAVTPAPEPPAATPPVPAPAPTAAPASRPPVQEFAANPNLKDLNFDFDKYDIRPGDAK